MRLTESTSLPGSAILPECVDLGQLATLLARSAGFVGQGAEARRLVPTGGGLGSVELYVIAREIDGLAHGVYHYDAPRHALERLHKVPHGRAAAALGGRSTLADGSIVAVGSYGRSFYKYGAFAYRLVHLDAGVALGYLRVVAKSLGVAVSEFESFADVELAAVLGIPWESQQFLPTFAVAIGCEAFAATRRDAVSLPPPRQEPIRIGRRD
jgi:SagB-type dehydrogenase family enzyme